MDDWTNATGSVAAMAHVLGVRSAVATPIIVEGRLWGTMVAVTSQSEPLPADIEARIGDFTELVATAIANAQSREALAELAEEQAALRRVATLVANGVEPGPLFDALAGEIEALLGRRHLRCAQIRGRRHGHGHGGKPRPSQPRRPRAPRSGLRRRCRVPDRSVRELRFAGVGWRAAGRSRASGACAPHLQLPSSSTVELWGAITIASLESALLAGTDRRLADFSALFATAIANAQSREALAALAEEQGALHRVATLVAEGVEAQDIFDAVCQETSQLLGARAVNLSHYTSDGFNLTVAGTHLPVGTRVPIEPDTVAGAIIRTRAPARVDDWE